MASAHPHESSPGNPKPNQNEQDDQSVPTDACCSTCYIGIPMGNDRFYSMTSMLAHLGMDFPRSALRCPVAIFFWLNLSP
ncbi:hypothetical protein NPIL_259231 [Nephila pilipes]|uniref:Uncharacterized protein n=1 Tax=Nephila pilipes TaxID=299642 RepID=A0A8X6MSG6_NEPPI|nr:hypothetical protein NPIL_259231 [Nephila pilipes]